MQNDSAARDVVLDDCEAVSVQDAHACDDAADLVGRTPHKRAKSAEVRLPPASTSTMSHVSTRSTSGFGTPATCCVKSLDVRRRATSAGSVVADGGAVDVFAGPAEISSS